MSREYEGQDRMALAQQAERDLNSHQAKHGYNSSNSADESGVDAAAASKFPGGSVTVGSAASGAGDNREIPVEEGGEITSSGQPTKAQDFEGPGGPETKQAMYEEANPGNDDVASNVRQGNETVRPAGQMSGHGSYGTS